MDATKSPLDNFEAAFAKSFGAKPVDKPEPLATRNIGKYKLAQDNVKTPDDAGKFFSAATREGADGMCTFNGCVLVNTNSPIVKEAVYNTGLKTVDVVLRDGSHVAGIQPQAGMDAVAISRAVSGAYERAVVMEMAWDDKLQKFDGVTLCNITPDMNGAQAAQTLSAGGVRNPVVCQTQKGGAVNVFVPNGVLSDRVAQKYEDNVRNSNDPSVTRYQFDSKQEAVNFLNDMNREGIDVGKEGMDAPSLE